MANTWLSKLAGTMLDKLGIGGPDGFNVKNNATVAEIRNAADNAFATIRALNIAASGETINDLVSLLDLKGRCPLISFSFTGASPPSAGDNTGKFGFAHTSGGSYTAGDVVYDSGTALLKLPVSVCTLLTTGVAVSGTVSLIDNGLYALEDGSWTLKGDGGSSATGLIKSIAVAWVGTGGTTSVSSTTAIPDGATVTKVCNKVTTGLDGSGTILVIVDGTSDETILATADSDSATVGEYENYEKHAITAGNTGVVKVTVGGTPTVGAGTVLVEYTTPSV